MRPSSPLVTTASLTATCRFPPVSTSSVGELDRLELAGEHARDARLELVPRNRAEEPDPAEVDADHRDPRRRGTRAAPGASSRRRRARSRPATSAGAHDLGRRRSSTSSTPCSAATASSRSSPEPSAPGGRAARRPPASRGQPTASSIQRSSSSGSCRLPAVGQVDEELPVPLRPGETGVYDAEHPRAPRLPPPRRRRAARAGAPPRSRTTPFGVSARPASNCGFTRTSASQPGAASREQRRQRRLDGDERDVADDDLGREREARDVPGVDALEHGDAVVGAEPRVQLAVADVERDHAGRAGLEEAVREPAGRRADVEAVLPGRVERRSARARGRASRRRARRSAAAARPRARPTRRAGCPACRTPARARRSRAPAPGCASPRARAPRAERRAASSSSWQASRMREERIVIAGRELADRPSGRSGEPHRRGALRGGRVPALLGRALAERARARRLRRDARSRRPARARARLRARAAVVRGGSRGRRRGRDGLGSRGARARRGNAERERLRIETALARLAALAPPDLRRSTSFSPRTSLLRGTKRRAPARLLAAAASVEGTVLVADPGRRHAAAFFERASRSGWSIEHVAADEIPSAASRSSAEPMPATMRLKPGRRRRRQAAAGRRRAVRPAR